LASEAAAEADLAAAAADVAAGSADAWAEAVEEDWGWGLPAEAACSAESREVDSVAAARREAECEAAEKQAAVGSAERVAMASMAKAEAQLAKAEPVAAVRKAVTPAASAEQRVEPTEETIPCKISMASRSPNHLARGAAQRWSTRAAR